MKRFEYKIISTDYKSAYNLNVFAEKGWRAYAAVKGDGCIIHMLERELPEETKDN